MDLVTRDTNCKFFIAAGPNEEEQKIVDAITNSKHKQNCIAINKMDIADTETLAIIKNCDLACCTDSSFSHIAAALEIPTITIMTDTPMLYGSYHNLMHPILPSGLNHVTHNSRGAEKIKPEDIDQFVCAEIPDADSDKELREQVLAKALKEANAWHDRYSQYHELSEIFKAIKKVNVTV
mgnify:CR=1 FL=1